MVGQSELQTELSPRGKVKETKNSSATTVPRVGFLHFGYPKLSVWNSNFLNCKRLRWVNGTGVWRASPQTR